MKREIALAHLRPLEQRLRQRGVSALYLFGSTARDDAKDNSDLDLVFDVEPGKRLSLFDQAELTTELSNVVGTGVDFILRTELHPYLKPRIESELLRVF
jgi:predicted nucleotidyltransferase